MDNEAISRCVHIFGSLASTPVVLVDTKSAADLEDCDFADFCFVFLARPFSNLYKSIALMAKLTLFGLL